MNNLKIEEKAITAYVFKDESEGVYTVFSAGKGGPIISDTDKYEAVRLFEKAIHLSYAVLNLEFFSEALKLSEKSEPKIRFIEKSMA